MKKNHFTSDIRSKGICFLFIYFTKNYQLSEVGEPKFINKDYYMYVKIYEKCRTFQQQK
jgi:hypothetical protein